MKPTLQMRELRYRGKVTCPSSQASKWQIYDFNIDIWLQGVHVLNHSLSPSPLFLSPLSLLHTHAHTHSLTHTPHIHFVWPF